MPRWCPSPIISPTKSRSGKFAISTPYRPSSRAEETGERNPSYDAPDRPWYQNAIRNAGKTTWTIYGYSATSTPGMDASVTLEREGEQLGVISVGIELIQLSEY